MRLTVLITRPLPDALSTAALLKEHGIQPLIAPMLDIRVLTRQRQAVEACLIQGVQAVIVTSANGARALGQLTAQRNIPAVAVGEATAAALLQEGFASVTTAGGDSGRLLEHVKRHFSPDAGRMLYASAANVATDLPASLTAAGFAVERQVIYEAVPQPVLAPEIAYALEHHTCQAVLFYSARTARMFLEAAAPYDLAQRVACCLSAKVAEALQDSNWGAVRVAETPTQEGMLALVIKLANSLERL